MTWHGEGQPETGGQLHRHWQSDTKAWLHFQSLCLCVFSHTYYFFKIRVKVQFLYGLIKAKVFFFCFVFYYCGHGVWVKPGHRLDRISKLSRSRRRCLYVLEEAGSWKVLSDLHKLLHLFPSKKWSDNENDTRVNNLPCKRLYA